LSIRSQMAKPQPTVIISMVKSRTEPESLVI
jgi:hypothetical protein